MPKTVQFPTLPKVLEFTDYHEIEAAEELFQKVFGKKVRVREIGFGGFWYIGLVYEYGFKPDEATIKAMLKKANIELE